MFHHRDSCIYVYLYYVFCSVKYYLFCLVLCVRYSYMCLCTSIFRMCFGYKKTVYMLAKPDPKCCKAAFDNDLSFLPCPHFAVEYQRYLECPVLHSSDAHLSDPYDADFDSLMEIMAREQDVDVCSFLFPGEHSYPREPRETYLTKVENYEIRQLYEMQLVYTNSTRFRKAAQTGESPNSQVSACKRTNALLARQKQHELQKQLDAITCRLDRLAAANRDMERRAGVFSPAPPPTQQEESWD